jgi:hypothetical protein
MIKTRTIKVLTSDGRVDKLFAPNHIGRTEAELIALAEKRATEIGGWVRLTNLLHPNKVSNYYQP